MLAWRISPFHDLNGEGGRFFSARWHFAGIPVVYLADSPAGALLEICVHTAAEKVPKSFTLLKIAGPDIEFENVALDKLPFNWVNLPETTQQLGDEWLRSHRSALLRVPSALVPEAANFLLNPLHPDAAQFQIERAYKYPFDLRLKS